MMRSPTRSNDGYTLVELMVVVFLTTIAVVAMYRSYVALRIGMEVQEQQAEIHQNLRIGVQRLARELRMASFDPEGNSEAGFVTATDSAVRFTRDLDDDGDTTGSDVVPNDLFSDEDVTYAWVDTNADGTNDALRRIDNSDGSQMTVVTNIDALRFVYLTDDDPPEILAKPLSAFDRKKVRDIEIIMVARATNADGGYTNGRTYYSTMDEDDSGAVDVVLLPQNDHFRRGRLTARVKARNAGLN